MNKRFTITFLIILLIGLLAIVGCTSEEEPGEILTPWVDETPEDYGDDYNDEEPDEEAPSEPEIPIRGSREGVDRTNDTVVATVNGIEIWASDVIYEMLRVKPNLAWEYFPPDMDEMDPFAMSFGFDFTDIDFETEVRPGMTFARLVLEESVRAAADLAVILDYGRRIGVELTEEDMEMIDLQIMMLLEQGGADMFYMMLEQEGIRDIDHLFGVLSIHAELDQLVSILMSNPEEFALFEEFMPVYGCDADTRIEALMERVLAGEDFATLIRLYGEDPGMGMYPDGYTFVSGDMVQEFEDAVLALEIGEVSGIVRTDFGFHIIMRVEPDPDNVMTGSRFSWDGEDEELLGAKHILTLISERTLEDRKIEAILAGFEVMNSESELIFLPALDDIVVGP
ncbi:MAG: peptidyl-prolyl cis-trans isomerase [Defluviitaleaceae bacterium]|nr:peptidyl-prolyl cis-trans isomerase [Defluviitaleaceae bacterium]